jgi:hypothetical protein
MLRHETRRACSRGARAQADKAVPEQLRTLALRALAVQLMDRTRHSSVIAAISVGGQSGLLSQLMHSAARPRRPPGPAPAPTAARRSAASAGGPALSRCAPGAPCVRTRRQRGIAATACRVSGAGSRPVGAVGQP